MSDLSDDDVEDGAWILYKNKYEWKDVEPVAQDDGPHVIVAIAYSEKCKQKLSIVFLLLPPQFHVVFILQKL